MHHVQQQPFNGLLIQNNPGEPDTGQTYWNNHWIFMSQMSFLPLNLLCQRTRGKPSGLVVFSTHV